MLKMKWTQLVLLVTLPLWLAACGAGIDKNKLEGTWKLKKIEGGGSASTGLRIRNGKFEVAMAIGGFGCGADYRVDGRRLKVDSNVTRSCSMASLDVEVDSVTDSELVLKDGNTRFIYEKVSETN